MIRMKGITGSSAKILQYSMNLHKGPKNPSRSLFAQPNVHRPACNIKADTDNASPHQISFTNM